MFRMRSCFCICLKHFFVKNSWIKYIVFNRMYTVLHYSSGTKKVKNKIQKKHDVKILNGIDLNKVFLRYQL